MPVVSETPKAVRDWRIKRDKELSTEPDPHTFYEQQTEIWRPWMQAVSEHKWRFIEGPCLNCGQLTTVMEAGNQIGSPRWSFKKDYKMTLCPECLNIGSPWYPTGWVVPDGTTYVRHSESCTLHSSYPTSSSSMRSEETSLRLSMPTTKASSQSSTSSSRQKAPTARTSSPDTPSRPSASLRRMSLNSSTRRN